MCAHGVTPAIGVMAALSRKRRRRAGLRAGWRSPGGYDRRVRRRIYVGDVQGCREELERLLERARFDPAADRLEPAGDVVNRGPDSLGTLRLLKSLDAGGVLGNHDVHLLRVAKGLARLRPRDTLQPVLDAPDREELLDWLASRPLATRHADEGVVLVHAGFHPRWADPVRALAGVDALRDPRAAYAVSVRYCAPDGRRPDRDEPPPGPPFAPWYAWWTGRLVDTTLVFGHWARRGLVRGPGLRGLDTGCVWGGRLTAWIAGDDRMFDVPAARAYARP
jgi:bis(5'-nucleosyl)-tetraphosphatase (symmetrical)